MVSTCFTGHRQLNGEYYNRVTPSATWGSLKKYLDDILIGLMTQTDNSTTQFISGLAIGVDMLAAECVAYTRAFVKAPIMLTGAMPFPSQSSKWPQQTKTPSNMYVLYVTKW